MRDDAQRPDWLPWIAGAVTVALGLLFLILMPPLYNPDEMNHLYRAEQISRGELLGRRIGADRTEAGGTIDGNLMAAFVPYISAQINRSPPPPSIRGLPEAAIKWGGPAMTIDFRNTAIYPPYFYLPSVAAILGGKALGASIHQTFYAARLLNLLAAVAVLVTALALFRTGRTVAATVLLFPTAVSQYAAVSQDGLLITVGALAAALASRPLSERRAATGVEIAWITALLALLFVTRPPLVPLALLPWALARRPLAPWGILPTLGLVAVTAGWSLYAGTTIKVPWWASPFHYSMTEQLTGILTSPATYGAVLWRTMSDLGHGYLLQAVAVFGLLDVFLPGWVYGVAALGIGLALLRDGHTASGGNGLFRGTGVIAVAGTWLLIMTIQYLDFSPVGFAHILGVQGRYFLTPALFLGLLLPHWRLPAPLAALSAGAPFLTPVLAAATLPTTIALHYAT
ncbi:hypothetical protein ABAZ39_33335 (plasmid) [Azospirillum argentinense]|uniref:DUF2142 domain-containing protein n=1 Tax=Azospirillum argentinense TaxID=2970906 RepID=A0A060E157_9PROT|nr:DUF2142 domain-containing protein [Azospirillum argentinense]AIB16719.1 hypothetical protein ABAZ39_33335 [Azospirillum argentinense]EZQ02368.1 hypothetical protein ABAZ39_32995 [Azospirillum argentinense]